MIPFVGAGEGHQDQDQHLLAETSQLRSKKAGGLEARRDIVTKCMEEWKATGQARTARKHTLEGIKDTFRASPLPRTLASAWSGVS